MPKAQPIEVRVMDNVERARLDLAMSLKRKKSTEADGSSDAALSATYYFCEIQDWNLTFSFGANEPGDIDGPYFDYRQLEVKCSALGQLSGKVTSASGRLLPMHALDNNDARRMRSSSFVGRLANESCKLHGRLSVRVTRNSLDWGMPSASLN
ncbi:hypothetical protein [Tardiphaga robiniae]|uniref:Uncharacterized protein n=1 Tax=Tardiphaga robiniae TaxID=943830 RepID=A0A7G6TSV6_9BRAD|nr:hypothetical protein [Tardiphaga robiniae]QND69838.1 hypothetical protein HB776_00170 [Tardiphaga robiniae]